MAEDTITLPGLSPVGSKPLQVAFDGGRLSSDFGVILLGDIDRHLKISERLASCLTDPRDPSRVVHGLAEMIRFRALMIAAGYPDGDDCDALRQDPAFKLAVGRLPESGPDRSWARRALMALRPGQSNIAGRSSNSIALVRSAMMAS